MTEDLHAIDSDGAWLRHSNRQGNCIEVCRTKSGLIRIRESSLPRRVVEIHEQAWAHFLRRCRWGCTPEPHHDGDMISMLIVDAYSARYHFLPTTATSIEAFCVGVRAGAFDEISEAV